MHHPSIRQALHELPFSGDQAEGKAAGHGLPVNRQVRLHPKQFLRPSQGHPEAGDDLVEDEQHAMPGAEFPKALQISGVGKDATVVAHDGLGHHGGDFRVPLQGLPDHLQIVPGEDDDLIQNRGRLSAREERGPVSGSVRFRHDVQEDVIKPAVVVALELEDFSPSGQGSSHAKDRVGRVGPAVGEPDQVGAGQDLRQQPGQLDLQLALGRVKLSLGLLEPDPLQHLRVGMSQQHGTLTQGEVQILVAVHVPDPGAPPFGEEHGVGPPQGPKVAADAAGQNLASLRVQFLRSLESIRLQRSPPLAGYRPGAGSPATWSWTADAACSSVFGEFVSTRATT